LEERKVANQLAREMLDYFKGKEDSKNAQAKMMLSIAEVNYDKRGSTNRELARGSAKEALAQFKDQSDKRMEAATLLVLCNITMKDKTGSKEQHGQEASVYAQQAVKLHRSLGDRRQEALALHNMAAAFMAMRDVERALKVSKEALRIFRELGDKKLEAYELQCVALWQSESQPQEALSSAEAALAASREVDGKDGRGLEASALGTLVRIQSETNPSAAVKVAKGGLRRFRELQDKDGEAQAMKAVASASQDEDPQNALVLAQRAQAAFKALGDSRGEQIVQRMVSELQVRVQRGDKALESAMLSLKQAADSKEQREIANSMFTVARVYLARGDGEKVLEYAQLAQSICKKTEWKRGEAEALVLVCRGEAVLENLDESLVAVNEAKDLLKLEGDRPGEARMLAIICELQILNEDFEAAVEAAEELKVLAHELNDVGTEVAALLLAARAGIKILQQQVEEDPKSMNPADESYKATYRAAREALTLSRLLRDRQLVASAQYMMAEIYLLSLNAEAALGAIVESASLSRKAGDLLGEAAALQLSAGAHHILREMEEAWEAASRALDLNRQAGNEEGAETSAEFLEMIWPHWESKAPQKAAVDEEEEVKEMAIVAAVPKKAPMKALGKRTAVDITSGVGEDMIRAKIGEVLEENLGLDFEDFEDDTPMMEAGLTSGGAILLQSAMSVDFPTVKLPATLIFDYPTTRAVVQFIMDALKK